MAVPDGYLWFWIGTHDEYERLLNLVEDSIAGTMTGSATDAKDTLSFSSLQQIRPMIETVPLEAFGAAEAHGRMMRNEARFRIVLVTG